MTRASRIPYHQNVYDLLQLEPAVCPDAARMIAEHEAARGPLPASLREWYLYPKVVPLLINQRWLAGRPVEFLWEDYSANFRPEPLDTLLAHFRPQAFNPEFPDAQFATDEGVMAVWWVYLNGTPDPPVWFDYDESDPADWQPAGESFSDFVSIGLCDGYTRPNLPRSRNSPSARTHSGPPLIKPYANGLWLRTPAEPFEPAVIDYLTDHLGEPERTPRPGNVTTHTFRSPGGIVRITADEPNLGDGLSAWWVHADTPERLAELGRLVVPFGTLRDTLPADTDRGREVLRTIS